MKLTLKSISLLLSLSLSLPMSALAESDQNWDVIVKKNSTVPFDGVLVPEDSYRFYQKAAMRADIMQQNQNELRPTSDVWGLAVGFVVGVVVTAAFIQHR